MRFLINIITSPIILKTTLIFLTFKTIIKISTKTNFCAKMTRVPFDLELSKNILNTLMKIIKHSFFLKKNDNKVNFLVCLEHEHLKSKI